MGVRRGMLDVLAFEFEAKEKGRAVVGVIGGRGEGSRRGVTTGRPLRTRRRGVARGSSVDLVGVERKDEVRETDRRKEGVREEGVVVERDDGRECAKGREADDEEEEDRD